MEMPFSEVKKLGADCIADIDHVDLLISLRNLYLKAAKDLVLRSDNWEDYNFGISNCKLAEAIQYVIDELIL